MPEDSIAQPGAHPAAPSLSELFIAFVTISVCGFGGVLAWSRRILVEVKHWMSAEEFNDAYALCQMLPGPNIVNLSVVFGSRIRGGLGAAVALGGLLGPPVILISAISVLYGNFGELPAVQRTLTALAAAAAGLVIGTCAKMAEPLFRGPLSAPLVSAAAFVAIGILRWPLPYVLLALLPISIGLAWWVRR